MANNTLTNAIYWAAQTPAVQALQQISDESARNAAAMELAVQGALIDVPIMVWNYDAEFTMNMRQSLGFAYVPSGFATVEPPPGVAGPGMIKVSTDATDYPAYVAPAPVVVPPATDGYVGPSAGSGYFGVSDAGKAAFTSGTLSNNTLYTAPSGHTYQFFGATTPFGFQGYFIEKS